MYTSLPVLPARTAPAGRQRQAQGVKPRSRLKQHPRGARQRSRMVMNRKPPVRRGQIARKSANVVSIENSKASVHMNRRASLQGMRLSVCDELRSHTIPLILAACCWLLHVCVETRQALFKLLAAACGPISPCRLCGPISPCCRMHACSLNLSMLLSCLQDDRDPHQLCSGEDDRAQPRDHAGGVSPGWDQDCIGIVRRDDHSLGFWCAGALKSPLLGQN